MKTKRTPSADMETIMPLLMGVWRRFQKEGGPDDRLQTREFRLVVENVKKLQNLENMEDYFQDKNLLGAYLLYNFAVNYQQGLSVIGELPFAPKRVLDICSGPGAFGIAALKHGADEVFVTDQNATALKLASEISGRLGLSISTRVWNPLKAKLPIEGKFDLITLGYGLEELFPGTKKGWPEDQQRFVQMLLGLLTPNGCLILVESSQPESNRRLLELRDRLVQEGVPVQAPCVWKGACPALKTTNSPCYAQREFQKPYLIREIQRGAEIKLGSLKFSYVIFRNPTSGWPELPESLSNGHLDRIISPPIEIHQTKRFYLCGTQGKKILESRLKEHPPQSKAFEYLKRGELIAIEDADEKLNILDINESSKLKVIAACGKPLPMLHDFTEY